MEEKDIPLLEEITSIIVKGKANLPSSAVKLFRTKGRADEYFIFEGRYKEITGQSLQDLMRGGAGGNVDTDGDTINAGEYFLM